MKQLWLGTWGLTGHQWSPIDANTAKRTLQTAFDHGIRAFDTAESYGNGQAEQLLGQLFRNVAAEIRIATKSQLREPEPLRRHLATSLRRLHREYVDLYYIHWTREGLPLEPAIEELERQRSAGRVRRIGLCNVTAREIETARSVGNIDVIQVGYNAIWRKPEEKIIPFCEKHRIPMLSYSPLAQGLLAHRFPADPTWHPNDHRQKTPLFTPPAWPQVHRFHERFHSLAEAAGTDPVTLAFAWILKNLPGTDGSGIVVGGRSRSQVIEIAEAWSRTVGDCAVEPPVLRAFEVQDRLNRPTGHIPSGTTLGPLLNSVTELSDQLQPHLPNLQNMFGYRPNPVGRRSS